LSIGRRVDAIAGWVVYELFLFRVNVCLDEEIVRETAGVFGDLNPHSGKRGNLGFIRGV
jgi:hypothetical protein